MFFPFKIQYVDKISDNVDNDTVTSIIKDTIRSEGVSEFKITIQDNRIEFDNAPMSKNMFHSVENGVFEIIGNDSDRKLSYCIYVGTYEIIVILLISVIVAANRTQFGEIEPGFLNLYFYPILVWFCVFFSHKAMFKKIVKRLGNARNEAYR